MYLQASREEMMCEVLDVVQGVVVGHHHVVLVCNWNRRLEDGAVGGWLPIRKECQKDDIRSKRKCQKGSTERMVKKGMYPMDGKERNVSNGWIKVG